MSSGHLLESATTGAVIGAFFDVYNTLGFGFFEAVYARALELELLDRGHSVSREVTVPVLYKGWELGRQRIDMIVDGKVVVESKSTSDLHPNAHRQVYNYLRATSLEVGLLLHFGSSPKFHRLILQQRAPTHRIEEPHGADSPAKDHA